MPALVTTTPPDDDRDDEIDHIPTPEELGAFSTEKLRGMLAAQLGITARKLVRLAAIWTELERRGEDLSALRGGLACYLPLIASGAVLPEAVVAFAGNATMLRHVTGLPIDGNEEKPGQRELAAGGTVLLVVLHDGQFDHRMLPIVSLSQKQLRQVFNKRNLRTKQEQIGFLSVSPGVDLTRKAVTTGRVTVNKWEKTVKIGTNDAPIVEVLEALRKAGVLPAA